MTTDPHSVRSTALRARETAAFFDLDNTLIYGSSLFQIARGMVSRGAVKRTQLAVFIGHQLAFRLRGEHAASMAFVQDATSALARGHDVHELEQAAEEIFDKHMASRFNPGALALLETHLAAGHQVFLATAAPVELAAIIAGRLRLSGALGTVCERSEGRFTGRLVSPLLHGPAKAHAVAALIARERLNPHSCYAYSDSVNDLPMLSLVGYPAAINPDRQLRRIANDRYWPIHDSRRRRFWPSSAKTLACSGAPTIYAHPAETAGLSVITGTKP